MPGSLLILIEQLKHHLVYVQNHYCLFQDPSILSRFASEQHIASALCTTMISTMNRIHTLAAITAATLSSQAAITMTKDAASFTNTYDGSQISNGTSFINGWTVTGGANPVNPSLSGTTLTATTPGANGWIQQDSGTSDWETGTTGSWTFEATISLGPDDGLAFWLDAANGGRITYVGANGIGTGGNGSMSNQSLSTVSNIGTHTFRFAHDNDTGLMSMWRDGILVSDTLASGGISGGPRLIIGDCCSGAGGVTIDAYEIESFNYDTSGAFAPIPEPSSALLFGLTGLGLLFRRKK